MVTIVHIAYLSRRAKRLETKAFFVDGANTQFPANPELFSIPRERGGSGFKGRGIRPRCRRNRFTTVRYQDVRIVHGWAWISRVHNEVERRSRGKRERRRRNRCRNQSKEGGVGERRKVKERGERGGRGRANGEMQLGGDQDTERSAAPAATLLCLGFIREGFAWKCRR